MSSFIKYRIKEVAQDFGVAPKEIAAIVEQYFEKPKSTAQVLDEAQLNLIFDLMTQRNQIPSVEVVFAAAFAAKEAEEKKKAEEAARKAAEEAAAKKAAEDKKKTEGPKAESKPGENKPAQQKPGEKKPAQPAKPQEPQRKRERRVVDTSAVQVNADRFDDRVDTLISERDQNRSGGKQKIGNKNKKQQGPKSAKSREDERKRMNRLRLEAIKKTPLTVKIPDEITVGELAARMKKTAAEVIKCLI